MRWPLPLIFKKVSNEDTHIEEMRPGPSDDVLRYIRGQLDEAGAQREGGSGAIEATDPLRHGDVQALSVVALLSQQHPLADQELLKKLVNYINIFLRS